MKFTKYFGLFLVVVAVIDVALSKKSYLKKRPPKTYSDSSKLKSTKFNLIQKKLWLSVCLRLVALLFTGCEASILKKIIVLSSPEISFILWCFSGVVFGALLILFCKRRLESIGKSNLPMYFLAAICLSIMQFSTNIVFAKMEVGLALALFQLSAIINLFLGYKIFREGDMLRKFIGTVIMIIGAGVILIN